MTTRRFKNLWSRILKDIVLLSAHTIKARAIMWNAHMEKHPRASYGLFVVANDSDEHNSDKITVALRMISKNGIPKRYVPIPVQAIPELISTLSAVMLRQPMPNHIIEIQLKDK